MPQDDLGGWPHVMCQWITGSLERGNLKKQVTLVLVIRETKKQNDMGDAGSKKRNRTSVDCVEGSSTGPKVKLRDPESILRELKISWMFVESHNNKHFTKFGNVTRCCDVNVCLLWHCWTREDHGGLWIWPLGGNDEKLQSL